MLTFAFGNREVYQKIYDLCCEARKNPDNKEPYRQLEQYKHINVRVGGWQAPFISMSLEQQENYGQVGGYFMKKCVHKSLLMSIMIFVAAFALGGCGSKEEPLASWNDDSVNKQVIIDFVEAVTDKKSEAYVPVEDRIATFDMDGIIIAEKDIWIELAVAVYQIDNEMSEDKELVKEKDNLLANLKMDSQSPNTGELIIDVTGKAFEGMSQDKFVEYVNQFMQENKSDFTGIQYKDSFYKSMLELIEYLQANEFTVYLVSGSECGVIWGAAGDIVNLPRS